MKFICEIELQEKEVVGLFISACEGGSNYWCRELTPLKDKGDPYKSMLTGFKLIDAEDGDKKIKVTPAMILKAVQIFPKVTPKAFAALMDENDDAETGDQFLQLCAFGEIRYG